MKRETTAVWMLLLVAVVTAIAAVIPVFRGRPMNVTFLALAGFWLIVTIAVAAKARKSAAGDGGRGE